MALFLGLLAHLGRDGRIDPEYVKVHVSGLDEAIEVAERVTLDEVLRLTGLARQELSHFYDLFAHTERVVTVYSQGVNQSASGTDKVNAIINCHLATGRIGRPGMGPFSVTGQPNAMGGREVGGLANMLAAHMEIEDPRSRELVQGFWRSPAIAGKAGLKAVDMFRAVANGRIRFLWIMATNPVDSLPDANAVEAAIRRCPFVVVSDVMAQTDTVRHAHVKLPAAAWGEKDGTVTNSERRISRQRAFLPLPGEARPDWWIVAQVAHRMGFGDAFAWTVPAEIFAEHAALSGYRNNGSRDFDISGADCRDATDYDAMSPFQWPKRPGDDLQADTRFFANGGYFTPDGKARAIAVAPPGVRSTRPEFPFILNTGRVRDHWHTMTRTGKSQRLSAHMVEPYAELHPADAAALGIDPATIVRVTSAHGSVLIRALVTQRQRKGSVFVPMHWTDQFTAQGRVDTLVAPLTDPHSGQPASKNVAVRVEAFDAALYGFAVTKKSPARLDADYWALARAAGGWRLEFALGEAPVDPAGFATGLLRASLHSDLLVFSDPALGRYRAALFGPNGLAGMVFLAPEPVAASRSHAVSELEQPHCDLRARCRALAGRAGVDRPDPGAIVCACFSIGVNDIANAVGRGCRSVEAIGKVLGAGTNCGSCRAEIGGIIGTHPAVAR